MSRKLQGVSALALVIGLGVAGPAPLDAQVQTTVVLKNGQQHSGRNLRYRVDRREVAVRVSLHEEPRLPVDQVAYIDFGGTPERDLQLSGSENAVVMRDGTTVKGQVIELGHEKPSDESTPFLVIFRTSAGEERRVPASQVARVYFSGNAAATTGQASTQGAPDGQGIAVAGNTQWTPTGLTVRRGEVLTFVATGEVRLSTDGSEVAKAAGASTQRMAAGAPLPQNFVGALIGRVGNSAPFPIGDQTRVTMPANGQLFLGINDDHVNDNSGGFRVNVTRSTSRR